jgi:hypothetical protein
MLTMLKRTGFVKWIAATLFVATTATALSGCIVETGQNHRYHHHDYHRGY